MAKQLKEIEIPFGAKDSELCGWEYTIPEGMEATIVDNKIVVKKKESEDERIKKALIHLISEQYGFLTAINGISVKDILAWLEKQGEQRHADKVEPKFKVGDEIIHKELGGDFIHNPHKIIQVDILDKKYRLEGGLVAHFREQDDYELVEQKPWSEVDEYYHNIILYILYNQDVGKTDKENAINWFTSLKERYTWKPSDEQMSALDDVIDEYNGYPEFDSLVSLKNDLKKLKG